MAPIEKIQKYIERLGASKKESTSGRGHAFFNGRYLALDDVSLLFLSSEMMELSYMRVSFAWIGFPSRVTSSGWTANAVVAREGTLPVAPSTDLA